MNLNAPTDKCPQCFGKLDGSKAYVRFSPEEGHSLKFYICKSCWEEMSGNLKQSVKFLNHRKKENYVTH